MELCIGVFRDNLLRLDVDPPLGDRILLGDLDSSNDAIDLKTPAKPTANQMIVDTTISSGKPAVLAAAWARAMGAP
jgi:hypothetical protein